MSSHPTVQYTCGPQDSLGIRPVDTPDNMTACIMPTIIGLDAVFRNCCLNHPLGIIPAYDDDNCFTYCNYTTPYDLDAQNKDLDMFSTCFHAGRAKLNYTSVDGSICFGAKSFYGARSDSEKNRASIMSILLFCGMGLFVTFAV
jgi:hypothetical protein